MEATITQGKPRTKRVKWTVEMLKALRWGRRVRVVHGLFDGTEKAHGYLGLEEAFALCIRKTWPKGREWRKMVQCAKADSWHTLTGGRDSIGQPECNYEGGALKCGVAAGVYRLAYLVKPRRVNFGNMYKCGLFRIFSPDRRFMCRVELFKYDLALYFYCRPEDRFIPEVPALPEVFNVQPQTEEEAANWYGVGGTWAKHVEAHLPEWETYRKAELAHQFQGVIEPEWSTELVSCKSAAGRAWMALIVKAANRKWFVYPGNNLKV